MTQAKKYKTLEAAQREADIQAALESIRERALGMQTRADLDGVTKVLFEEFIGLASNTVRSSITIYSDASTKKRVRSQTWIGRRSLTDPQKIETRHEDHEDIELAAQSWQSVKLHGDRPREVARRRDVDMCLPRPQARS